MSDNEVFMILVAAIGFLFGIFVMIFIDGQMIACQRREILKLRKERAALQKENKKLSKLEIVYPEKNYFKPF